MELRSIKIKKLFGLFDYTIEINQDDDLTILTGPNGYGKTTILNIIHSLITQRFFYFQKLNFDLISVLFSNDKQINIIKKKGKEKTEQIIQIVNNQQRIINRTVDTTDINIDLIENNNIVESYVYNSETENKLMQELERYFPIRRMSHDLWIDERTGKQVFLREFLNQNSNTLPEKVISLIKRQDDRSEQILDTLSSINVYLIKEQRLLKQTTASENTSINTTKNFVNAIEDYAKELKDMIAQKQLEAFQLAQQLDGSFPKRLIECKEKLSKEEFDSRFLVLTQKQKQLQQYGISTTGQDVTEYNEETANVLSVYLGDSEKKASIFDDLLSKIDLFVNILNEKKFAFKSIIINSSQGFYFQTDNGQILNLTDLSSGEQHEVVLLYELLFKTTPNTLILIDEPEISLHVIWQKAFVQDLQEIAKMKQISFLVSTHSPQIINDRWDLTRDLYDLAKIG